LQVLPLDLVLFVHLLQNVHLVVLADGSFLGGSSIELGVLLSDGALDLSSLLVLQPLLFSLLGLLEKNVLFSGMVHVLEQVDSGLLLAIPLSLSHFVLSLGLGLDKGVYFFFVGVLVLLSLLVVLLELNDLLSSLESLRLLQLGESLFPGESIIKEVLVSLLIMLDLNLSQLTLSLIMLYQFKVPLSVKQEFLLFSVLVVLLLFLPLSSQHLLFFLLVFLVVLALLCSLLGLPGQNVDGVLNFLFVLLGLAVLSLSFFIGIKHPKLGVDLLLNNLVLQTGFLVHQLLFTLQLGSCKHELGFFFSKLVSFHFEFAL